MNNIYDSLIIGCGPCGIGAALKLKEAGLSFAIIEGDMPGGKVNIAPRVDNYPGYKEIPGPQLAMEFFSRINSSGIEVIYDQINSLTKENELFLLKGNEGEYLAKTVLIATGTKEKKIGLDKEDEFLGHGISYCALCDGHFFKGKVITVIGAEYHALKEAIHLSHIASKLYVINDKDEYKGNEKLANQLKEKDNVEFLTPYSLIKILGEDKVTGVVIENIQTKEQKELSTDGLFPLVGLIPNTQFVNIDGVLDEKGTIPVNKEMETGCSHLFAGGDVLPRDIRQIYLAEHDGVIAAKSIIAKLNK